jgi:RNA polymerase sigma factor (sigma-70 family)
MISKKQSIKKSATELLKDKFSDAASQILEPSSREGTAFLNYLQGIGNGLRISELDPREVLIEATTRGLYKIDRTGEEIYNPQAWLSKTCTFIMLDMMKAEKKNRLIKEKNTHHTLTAHALDELESNEERKTVKQALSYLSDSDQEILNLRFYQGKKYKEIQMHYLELAGVSVTVPALRKRESRAIERLQTKFLELYQ